MIRNTLLILGAGSSAECGFPVGEKLINDIYEFSRGKTSGFKSVGNSIEEITLENKQLIWRLLDISGMKKDDKSPCGIEDIERFTDALWDAQPKSIDEFLYDRKEFGLIGKICILCCLSRHEDEKGLRPIKSDDSYNYPNLDWYKYLWHSLTEGVDGKIAEFKKNRLKVITFNYDRSLEEFLIRAIKAKFGVPEWKAFEIFENSIEIYHVYGDLGMSFLEFNNSSDEAKKAKVTWIENSPRPMPYAPFKLEVLFRLWGNPGEYEAIERDLKDLRFTRTSDQDDLAKTVIERAMRIRTYTDNLENEYTSQFKKIIKDMPNIIFIGFAFHKQNLNVLGFGSEMLSWKTKICGTAYGLSNQELAEVKDRIFRYKDLPNSGFSSVFIYNYWDGIGKERSIIRNFFRNVEGVKLY